MPDPTNEIARGTKTSPDVDAPATTKRKTPRFQISLTLMMMMMIVFAVISAGLFYASRVPAIRDEISMLISGKVNNSGEDVGRFAHRVFIMFTFTSPLILAGTLSLIFNVMRWLEKRSKA